MILVLTISTPLDDIPVAVVATDVQAEVIAKGYTEERARAHVRNERGDVGTVYGIDVWTMNDDGIGIKGVHRIVTWSD